jgi:hypothetical protein
VLLNLDVAHANRRQSSRTVTTRHIGDMSRLYMPSRLVALGSAVCTHSHRCGQISVARLIPAVPTKQGAESTRGRAAVRAVATPAISSGLGESQNR